MKSIFKYTAKALLINLVLTRMALCMGEVQTYAKAVLDCDVETAQDLFSSKRSIYQKVVELAEKNNPNKNFNRWLLFVAFETGNQEKVFIDLVQRFNLFPALLHAKRDGELSSVCPTVKMLLWWFIKNDLNELLNIIDNVGPDGNAFPSITKVFLEDKEMMKYATRDVSKNTELKTHLNRVVNMYKN